MRSSTTREDLTQRLAAWLLTLPGPFAAIGEEEGLRLAHRAFDGNVPFNEFESALREFKYAVRMRNGKARIVSALDDAPAYRNHAFPASIQPDNTARDMLEVA